MTKTGQILLSTQYFWGEKLVARSRGTRISSFKNTVRLKKKKKANHNRIHDNEKQIKISYKSELTPNAAKTCPDIKRLVSFRFLNLKEKYYVHFKLLFYMYMYIWKVLTPPPRIWHSNRTDIDNLIMNEIVLRLYV